MKDKIIVVGEYGQVGKAICEELEKTYPYQVYAAGRNFYKAQQFSNQRNGKVQPLLLNVNEPVADGFFKEVALFVMCLDIQNTGFVQTCVKHGVDISNVTADYSVMSQIQNLRSVQSTVVLSVGLAPGITNMLVKQAQSQLDQLDQADIYILLGLGEAHGRAAIEWTVDNLGAAYTVIEKGRKNR